MLLRDAYPIPVNERQRVETVEALGIAQANDEPFFEFVADAVRNIYDLPTGLVSIVTADEQIFPAHPGLDLDRTDRTLSLCTLAVADDAPLLLNDTHLDPRVANHPVVTGAIKVRTYFGLPIKLSSGFTIGSLCALGPEPSAPPTEAQLAQHRRLRDMLVRFIENPIEPDRSKAMRIAAATDAAQEEFLLLVSHEMRTPLNGIFGLAQLLEPEDACQQDIADGILQSAELLSDVVDSILNFTELCGTVRLDEGPVDLVATVRAAADRVSALGAAHQKRCDLSALPGALAMQADAARVGLAISCVMMNFVIHGGTNAVVRIDYAQDGAIEVVIADDGAGIDEAHLDKVRQAFGVGASVRTRLNDGLGLGLPIASRVFELHGGALSLGNGPGGGLEVRIGFPAWRFGAARACA